MAEIDRIREFQVHEPASPAARSETLRLHVNVGLRQKQNPPWHDKWAIEMDETSLLQLSAELIQLPGPLTPHLAQLSRMLEEVVAHGLSEHWGAQGMPEPT